MITYALSDKLLPRLGPCTWKLIMLTTLANVLKYPRLRLFGIFILHTCVPHMFLILLLNPALVIISAISLA